MNDAAPSPAAPALTPGAYLRLRREAAGISRQDAAERLHTEPRLPTAAREEWIAAIEADVRPASFATIAALRWVYSFDLDVLATLAAAALGFDVRPPRLCRVCACSDQDGCRVGCRWVAPDLCSACAREIEGAPC